MYDGTSKVYRGTIDFRFEDASMATATTVSLDTEKARNIENIAHCETIAQCFKEKANRKVTELSVLYILCAVTCFTKFILTCG